jgi:NADH-quinone oxidoreductase subunit J
MGGGPAGASAGSEAKGKMETFVFLFSACLCLLSACAMVTRKNPVYAVLWMMPFILGMAILFVLLSAPFLAAMQVMVYGGAILVLFLFVIMLINLRPEELKDDFAIGTYFFPAILGGLLGGLIFSFALWGIPAEMEEAFSLSARPSLARSDLTTPPEDPARPIPGPAAPFGSLSSFGQPLFTRFLVPFELVSVLILVALLGVVILAKKRL